MRAMRPITVFGLILLALGVLALAYQGVIYATHTGDTGQPEPVAFILSIVAVVVGIIFAVVGGRRRPAP
jgi:uncharacterized membrane protein YidH (DUF202 family)